MLDHQLAWYIGGPLFGACVVACRALFGGRLGVTGGFTELVDKLGAGRVDFDWRGWFALGILGGGILFGVLHGGPVFHGFGWMTRTFDGPVVPVLLLAASGVAIGWGAKRSGGCTSGNGLSGTAMLSPGSLVATMTFFATAIAVSFAIEALT